MVAPRILPPSASTSVKRPSVEEPSTTTAMGRMGPALTEYEKIKDAVAEFLKH